MHLKTTATINVQSSKKWSSLKHRTIALKVVTLRRRLVKWRKINLNKL